MENSNNVNVLANVVQATHHQGDIPSGIAAGIQCSCVSLKSISWRMLKTIARCDNDDLNRILQNGDCLYKFFSMFRLLGAEYLPAELNICGQVIRIELLENKTREIVFENGMPFHCIFFTFWMNSAHGVLNYVNEIYYT